MRQIGTLSHENEARRFSNYLNQVGIASKCEVFFDPQNGQMTYQIWIQDEDKIEEASQIFAVFKQNPSDPKFEAPEPEPEEPIQIEETDKPPPHVHHFKAHLTYFLIALCVFVYFLSGLQELQLAKESDKIEITPIQALFMYDLPNDSQGIYGWVVAKIKGENPAAVEGPLFTQIGKGQIWRLFTPCLLHKDLLHILFNMLWLWYLGRPIERRIGPFRTLLLTLIGGIASNTLQYLMSGPLFIGYSGVITALAGFIWMRERIAPWEGYPLNRATIFFLLLFILAIFVLQLVSFFIQISTSYSFAPNIANTAHIGGAVIGALLARLSFFAQRVKP